MNFANVAVLAAFAVVTTACTFGPVDRSTHPDTPGTFATAQSLTLGACGGVQRGSATAEVVLNPHGLCVFSATRVDTCHRYEGMEVEIDGVRLKQRYTGGWLSGGWCSYPSFEIDCGAREEGRPPPDCSSTALMSKGGPQHVTIRIGGETRTVTVNDWLIQRAIRLPGGLIPGQRASVTVEPHVAPGATEGGSGVRAKVGFSYDEDGETNSRMWCAARNPEFGYDVNGTCTEGCCSTSDVMMIEPEWWSDEGFEFTVPEKLPQGSGRFTFGESREVNVEDCPFAKCRFQVGNVAEAFAEVGRALQRGSRTPPRD